MSEQGIGVTDRVWTVPNILSFIRLAGVPIFLWLLLGPREDVWAVVVLALAGVTDFLDGRIARATGQISRLGEMLDPLADRLYILATIVGLAVRGVVPWWLVGVLLARDLLMVALVPLLRRRGFVSLPVHFLGKAATFCLLYAFPLVLLGSGSTDLHVASRSIGWAFALWGTGLYWWAGVLYLDQTARLLRETTALEPSGR